ncbi:MAG: hypothetical protein WCV73_00175 [Patescibacteria group bacterium]|jgi:hypothetical protein
MKIMLIWDSSQTEVGKLIQELEQNNHELVYWLGGESEKHYCPNNAVFHNCKEAILNKPADGFTVEQFPTPSKELIQKLHHAEAIILTMMNGKFGGLATDLRKHFYYNSIRYWQGILNLLKPEAIIFVTVPHTPFDYLIYELAKILNIKTILLEGTWISDRAYVYDDFREPIKKIIEVKKLNQGKNFEVSDLSSDLQNYFFKQTDPAKDSTPLYMPIQFKQYLGKSLWLRRYKHLKASLKSGALIKNALAWLNKKIGPNLKKDYEALQVEPDLTKPFVYAALHLQPEMTTSPQGDIYVDQILLLETLSHALPKNWVIYVKEHPIQWLFRGLSYFDYRYKGYYQRIADLKNVYLVPVNYSSIKLVSHAQAVATATGTVAWEAVLRGKPGMVFGYPWYRHCDGVFTITSSEDCQEVYNKIINGYTVPKQEVINFLYYFDKATIHGYINMDIEKNTTLTPAQSAANIRAALLKELTNQN